MKKLLLILIITFLLVPIAQAQSTISNHPDVVSNIKLLEAWIESQMAYRDAWGDTEFLVMNGELVMIDPTANDPKEALLKLIPTGKNKFKTVADTFNYGEIGEVISFELGPDGKATRMKIGENAAPRLK